MVLLDAALAFALTIAALATVVTVIMEIAIRLLGLRKSEQVVVIKRLYDDHLAKTTGLASGDIAQRWQVVRKVLENPLAGTAMASTEAQQRYRSLGGGLPIYQDISLEHLLRRLIEVEEIKAAYNETERELKASLTALARKYDEYRSAMSVRFRSMAQAWSLLAGIGLALALNVDGVRLFHAYLDGPERAAAIIAQMDPILDEVERDRAALRAAAEGEPSEGTAAALDATLRRLEARLAGVQGFELPIGRLYYPHCLLLAQAPEQARVTDPLCRSGYAWLESLTWLIKAALTGLLIGLGAPFWYDVARRLAEVRRAFGGRGSALQRHRGVDAAATGKVREELIERIVREVRG